MTAAWTIIAIALAVGSFFVGWCFGCDVGERETNERWLRLGEERGWWGS